MSDCIRRIRDYETLIVSILLDRTFYSEIDIFELCCVCCEQDKSFVIVALDNLVQRGILYREIHNDVGFWKLLY